LIKSIFRSKTKIEQAETVQDILKAYQDEIDQLSRRSKASESAFNSLFKSLTDCIDPIPAIEHLLSVQAQVTPPPLLPFSNKGTLLVCITKF
jgi:homeobox protein cut-like